MLLCICSPNPWVLFSGVEVSCLLNITRHLQLLDRQMYYVARLFHDQSVLTLYHRRHVAGLWMWHKVNSNSNHCLFSELLESKGLYQSSTYASCGHWSLKYQGAERPNWKVFPAGPGSFVEWPSLHCVWHWTMDGFNGAVNRWLLHRFIFCFWVFSDAGAGGLAKANL